MSLRFEQLQNALYSILFSVDGKRDLAHPAALEDALELRVEGPVLVRPEHLETLVQYNYR